MQGRRVADCDHEAVEREGDYSVCVKDGRVVGCWSMCPGSGTDQYRRCAYMDARGFASEGEPSWEMTLDEAGALTVSPSIDEGPGGYHGYLVAGVWSYSSYPPPV